MLAEVMTWVEDKGVHYSQDITNKLHLTWATFGPKSHGAGVTAEEPKLKELKLLTMGSKQSHLILDLEWLIYLLESKQTCLLL